MEEIYRTHGRDTYIHTCMHECLILVSESEGRDHLEDMGVDGTKHYKLMTYGMRMWSGFIWLRVQWRILCEDGKER
jgi:hypothetical protein